MAKQDITNREKGGKQEKLPQEGYIKTKDTTTNKELIFAMYALLYTIGMYLSIIRRRDNSNIRILGYLPNILSISSCKTVQS